MKQVVLLRGVNVGGRTIKSADLKKCFESAGFQNVQTVLATGNVIIESFQNPATLKPSIEKLLEEYFQFPVKVCVTNVEGLAKIIADYPFQNIGPDFHKYVIFTEYDSPLPENLDKQVEDVAQGDDVLYWRVLKGQTLDSDFAKQLAKFSAKNFTTTRNLNTLEKITAKI